MKPRDEYGFSVQLSYMLDDLPVAVLAVLRKLTYIRLTGRQPTLEHYAMVLSALGETAAWQDAEIANTLHWLFDGLNDVARNAPNTVIPKQRRSHSPTRIINLQSDALKLIQLSSNKRAVKLEVHSILKRAIAGLRLEMVENWHRERQRPLDQQRLDPALKRRLALGVPPEAGATDPERCEWLRKRLTRAVELVVADQTDQGNPIVPLPKGKT